MARHIQLIFALIFCILVQFQTFAADTACGVGWLPYKDEKCYMILDVVLETFAEAEKSCKKLENEPTLPIIHSEEEQHFLSDYLFKTQKKVDNFWLGAKFDKTFKWIDNTVLDYTNWDPKGTKNKQNYCVQIQADDTVVGKWIDEPCEKKNAVVCQKMQTWSVARLQKAFLDERKQNKDALDAANRNITNLTHNLDNTTKELADAKVRLSTAESQIDISKKNPVPIGFIYVQLSNQPEPAILWSTVEWKDVTSEYAGLFFRAEGANAAQFGTVQEENSPRVTLVQITWFGEDKYTAWHNTTLNVGGWSSGIGIFSGSYYGATNLHSTHKFFQSGGEVRPKNTAMRVWKRIK